jgi:hypothetical protein
MTTVFHLDRVAAVSQCDNIASRITIGIVCIETGRIVIHKGKELTITRLILVSQIETEFINISTDTKGKAMRILPVRIICRRGIVDTW